VAGNAKEFRRRRMAFAFIFACIPFGPGQLSRL